MIRQVGFIGIGNMRPMAGHLVAKGFAVTAFDVAAGRALDFARQVGGTAAPDLVAAAHEADAAAYPSPSCRPAARSARSWIRSRRRCGPARC